LRRTARLLWVAALVLPIGAVRPALGNGAQLIDYLNQAVAWYRDVVSMGPLATEPAEVLLFNDARSTALEALRLAFDFARADAALFSASAAPQDAQPGAGGMNAQALARRVIEAQARVQQAQVEVDRLQKQLDALRTGARRATLGRQLAESKSELKLAQARKETLDALATFTARAEGGAASLPEQINAIERTVPELHPSPSQAAAATPAAAAPARASSDRGVLPLTADLFSVLRKQREIKDAAETTAALRSQLDALRAPLVADLRSTLQQGDQLSQAEQSTDAAVLEDRTRRLDEATAHFKKVSAALVPLGKQSILLDQFRGHLAEWDKLADRQTSIDTRGLVVRLALIALGIAVLLAGSEFWRRATYRYVQDARRRQQLLLLRRIVVTGAVVAFTVFALVTEISSIATFAGFITAGLAIALQTVILSVVAYFFLIGKYGVRVGDRVQISGVTGDVIDLGLIRLHLMEIGPDGQETGRVVVFSNAVLFQPTANFFKQLPGSNFTWHSVRLTLSPGSDYRLAEKRLMASVEAVFAKYREAMEAQHQRVSEDLSVQMRHLQPHSHLRLTEAGLEMTIRFPVPLDRAATVDDEVTRSLLEAIAREPRLKLSGSGAPTIETTGDGAEAAESH
jgi:small-conductance mechanosensitive channel